MSIMKITLFTRC